MSDSQEYPRSVNSDLPAPASILDAWAKRCKFPGNLEESCPVCSRADEPHAELCSACQPWRDLIHIFYCPNGPKPWEYIPMGTLGSLLRKTGCMLCRAISSTILHDLRESDRFPDLDEVLCSINGPIVCATRPRDESERGLLFYFGEKPGEWQLKCKFRIKIADPRRPAVSEPEHNTADDEDDSDTRLESQLMLVCPKDATDLLRTEVWDSTHLDVGLLGKWLQICEKEHGSDCNGDLENPGFSSRDLPLGFMVIDVKNMSVTPAPRECRYVALSYRWGSSKSLQLLKKNRNSLQQMHGLRGDELSGPIADAVELARQMGESYLWVDQLCIVQDELEMKDQQINSMDKIYRSAAFTIVIAVDEPGCDGLPGLDHRPRDRPKGNHLHRYEPEHSYLIPNSGILSETAWNSRGWTYQEHVLSRKCFLFTEYQSYFKCQQATFEEELGFQDVLHSGSSSTVRDDNYLFAKHIEPLQRYANAVVEYTPRTLSYPSDIEAAFAGVSNVLARDMDSSFVVGLPERYLPQCLLWTAAGPITRRRSSPEYPSWTWMGWICPVNYFSGYANPPYTRLFNFGSLVTFNWNHPQTGLTPVCDMSTWFFDESLNPSDFQHLTLPKLEKGQRHNFRTDSKELWSTNPHNPWTAAAHAAIDNESRHIAEKVPNCLVFNTTSAYFYLEPKEKVDESDYEGFFQPHPYLEKALKEHEELNVPIDLTVYDDNQNRVGIVCDVDRMWVRREITSDTKYEIIALSAGLDGRKVQKYYALADESPWLLNIMLVERHGDIAQRVGIGFLYPEHWEHANPQWKTIVLA